MCSPFVFSVLARGVICKSQGKMIQMNNGKEGIDGGRQKRRDE